MHRTTEQHALELLRSGQEVHAERHGSQTFTLGTHIPLEAAAQRMGLSPQCIRYYDAIEELKYEAAIEWDTSARYARGNKHYVITQHGLKLLQRGGEFLGLEPA